MVEIVPGIHWVEGFRCNVYILVDKELTLIDTGLPRKAKKILSYITQVLHRKPSDLKLIIITHAHLDHTGSLKAMKDATGAKIAAHPEDAEFISGHKRMGAPKGGIGIVFKLMRPFIKADFVEVDRPIIEGDVVAGLKVVHVPGHTPGSIALLDEGKKVLFSGDTLSYRDGKVVGPPEKFTMDPKAAVTSIARIKALDFDLMLCGHGQPLRPEAGRKVRETKFS
jgi:hydroxyacylglutathione hydrolase